MKLSKNFLLRARRSSKAKNLTQVSLRVTNVFEDTGLLAEGVSVGAAEVSDIRGARLGTNRDAC